MGPDFQLLEVNDRVGLVAAGQPQVGVIKEVHFLKQSGDSTKSPTSETSIVHYYVDVMHGNSILTNAKFVYSVD